MFNRTDENFKFIRYILRITLIIIVISLPTLVNYGCSSKSKTIIGKWEQVIVSDDLFEKLRRKREIEFFSDGRLMVSSKHENLTGNWVILDDGRINLNPERKFEGALS